MLRLTVGHRNRILPRTVSPRTVSRILVAPDSRTAERALIEELARAADAAPWGRKTVVVPSHSLRVALLARLAGVRPAWLGLEVVTLRGLARTVLERNGLVHRSGEALLPLVVERLARRERALAKSLETLVDGFAGARAAVHDLLDAGFTGEHLEFALERLEEERTVLGREALDRAAALCRIAAAGRAELSAQGLGVDADLYGRARDRLATDPDRSLPAAALFIHGFADATGVATDLLIEIARQRPTIALLLDPWNFDGVSRATWRFGRRLAERLEGIAELETLDVTPAPARLKLFAVGDPARETRAAVGILTALVEDGDPPEELAIVMRDPAPYRALLAREIDRQGLPASGGDGPAPPIRRWARGLLELVERRSDAALGVTFAVAGEFLAQGSGARPWELRLGALALGARRLGALAELEIDRDPVLLPLYDRFVPRDLPQEAAAINADAPGILAVRSRSLPREALRRARRQAAALLTRLDAQARKQTLGQAVENVASLVAMLVESEEDRQALLAPLAPFAEMALPGDSGLTPYEVTAAEAALLLREAWREVGAAPLGGAGGGTALLSVTEARGRTFHRIVLAGMTRDRFPRAVRADPFLPDNLRLRLRDLLPDLPVKGEGHDEERFLFAQILGAAPEIDLLVATADEEGKPLPPSSFLDELRRTGRIGDALSAPEPALPAALDLASRIALEGDPRKLAPALELAFSEGEDRFATGGEPAAAQRWTASHLALRAELGADPLDPRSANLGPFFGFAGERRTPDDTNAERSDPRSPAPAVTTLQDLAGCGWRTFLGRVLRLGPLPAGDDEIPELPRHLAGTVVHGVLERIAPPALSVVRTLAEAEEQTAGRGVEVAWPDDETLRAAISEETRAALTEEGLDPDLFALPVEIAAAEALEIVRRLDWSTGSRRILGLEVEGRSELELPEGRRRVGFRADRVELAGEALLLTDYKTGRSVVSDAVGSETRLRHLEKALAAGEWLQLPAYARAASSRPIEGRLLFLKDDLDDDRRDVRRVAPVAGSPAEAAEAALWRTLFAAWESGSFLPRLLDKTLQSSYDGCKYCEVRVACLQGDSGARQRLERWVRHHRSSPVAPVHATSAADIALEAAWRLFQLREPKPSDAEPEAP